jgi:hypothetical protein
VSAVLGAAARLVGDLVSPHFTVGELTDGRGWWPDDVAGEAARYAELATVLEQARAILGVPMRGISGARPIGHNDGGRASSMHLPPIQRAAPAMRYMSRAPKDRGAALDFIPQGMPCDAAFRLLDAAMRNGRLGPGGLFWYPSDAAHPGPASGRFVHIDNRGTLARERALTPPK